MKHKLASLIASLAGLVSVLMFWTSASAQSHAGFLDKNWIDAAPGTLAPSLQFINADGDVQSLDDLLGKAIVVNFWATWCGPCRAEMPTLQALAERHFDLGEHVVLAVALERNFDAAKRFLDGLGATDLTLVLDANMQGFRGLPDQNVGLDDVRGLPATLIMTADGHMLGHIVGPADWDEDAAHALVERALATSANAAEAAQGE